MMEYKLRNIGSITSSDLSIKPLTVIAGKNGSGKTFATKSLYAILSSVHENSFKQIIYEKFIAEIDNYLKPFWSSDALSDQYKQSLQYNFTQIIISLYINNEKEFKNDVKKFYFEVQEFILKNKNLDRSKTLLNNLDQTLQILGDLQEFIEEPTHLTDTELEAKISKKLKETFQISDLGLLKNSDDNIKIELDIGKVEIASNSQIDFEFSKSGVDSIQKLSNIIFLDSPIFLKLRKALDKQKQASLPLFDEDSSKYLTGIPKYIETLYKNIDREYIEELDFEETKTKIGQIINGDVSIDNGQIIYKSGGRNIPISLTAMGVSSFAIIYLLIKSNTLRKGSYLIIDEPEVHLHPDWQVLLMEILYELAQQGVHVVIASHSIEIVKYLEVFLKEKEDANEIIAINYMSEDEEFISKFQVQELKGQINMVLDDLGKPFFNLFSRA